jgi:hypothetical protein
MPRKDAQSNINYNWENTMKRPRLYLLLAAALVGCTFTNPFASQTYTGPTENIVCQDADLPGSYALVQALSGARPNQKLITDSTDAAGITQYIDTTGRLDGWENRYILAEPSTQLPGFILCEAVTFKTSDGAKQALHWPDTQSQPYETDRKIGDDLVVTWVEFNNPDNAVWRDYQVQFTYHNLLGVVHTDAPADIATADYALDIAEKMLGYFMNPPQGGTATPASP